MLNQYKTKLETKLNNLKKDLVSIESQDPYNREGYSDDNTQDDDAAEREDHDRVEAIANDLREKIVYVERALKKIADGNFGICKKCGQRIDKARLDFLPEAACCISCQRKM